MPFFVVCCTASKCDGGGRSLGLVTNTPTVHNNLLHQCGDFYSVETVMVSSLNTRNAKNPTPKFLVKNRCFEKRGSSILGKKVYILYSYIHTLRFRCHS